MSDYIAAKVAELNAKMGIVPAEDIFDFDSNDCVQISILCQDNNRKVEIAQKLHNQLAGNPDYIDSAIVLNIDNDRIVRLIVGDEAKPVKLELEMGGRIENGNEE